MIELKDHVLEINFDDGSSPYLVNKQTGNKTLVGIGLLKRYLQDVAYKLEEINNVPPSVEEFHQRKFKNDKDRLEALFKIREEILEAFLCKYNLPPEEVVLIEQKLPNGSQWWVQQKIDFETLKTLREKYSRCLALVRNIYWGRICVRCETEKLLTEIGELIEVLN